MDELLRVGLEVEFRGVDRDALRSTMRKLNGNRFSIDLHDDGSIRFPSYRIADVPLLAHHIRGRALLPPGAEQMSAYGPEVVTGVLTRQQAIDCSYFLSDLLYKVPETETASIHVHTSGFQDWKHIHNLLLWFYYLEAPLYRLAGLGKSHRGEKNDYKFCRPLSNSIALRKGREGYVPLIDIGKLITARNFTELLYSWGRMDFYWHEGIGHYCPHRLHGINIVPLPRIGTVELRIFNGVYRYIADALRISLALYDQAKLGPPPDTMIPMVLGEQPNFTLAQMNEILGFDVSPAIWGKRWPSGAMNDELLSHYSSYNDAIPNDILMRSVSWRSQ